HEPGGQVGDAHRGVGGVDALPAGPGGAVDVDAQIAVVDLHLDLLGLGHHQHADSRGVDAALGLGDGDALHAVHPALELQLPPHALAGFGAAAARDRDGDVLAGAQVGVDGADDLGLQAPAFAVPQVYAS